MAHPEIELDPERFHRRSSRDLMRDGAWLVPENERPKGWEKMGLSEPTQANPIAADVQPQNGLARSPLFPIAEKAYQLKDGEAMDVPVPADADFSKFRNNLGSYMRMSRGGVVQWSVRSVGTRTDVLRLTRVGFWPDVVEARGVNDVMATAAGVSKRERKVEETRTTTVERRTITETAEEPKRLPNAVRELSAEPASGVSLSVPVEAKRPAASTEMTVGKRSDFEDSTLGQLVDAVIRVYGPDDYSDLDAEDTFDKICDLGERLYAERSAKKETDATIEAILSQGGALDEDTEAAIRVMVYGLCVERRLLELSVLGYCKHLYRRGDPYGCDREARLLPPEDQDRLEKAKAEIDKEARAAAKKSAVSSTKERSPK